MSSSVKLNAFGLTDQGKVREDNQDQFLVAQLNKSMLVHHASGRFQASDRIIGEAEGHMLVVADGMGGHAGGRIASEETIEGIVEWVLCLMPWFFRLHRDYEDDLLDELTEAIRRSEKRLKRRVEMDPALEGMGTTLTMAYVLWPNAYVVHAGDSRCYGLRGDRLRQITRDHTMAQAAIDRGEMNEEQAKASRLSHMLVEAIGGLDAVTPDVFKVALKPGDTLMLCSDGLTGGVSDEEIQAHLLASDDVESRCRALVDAANEAGGQDNITVVVAAYGEPVEDSTCP